MNYRCIAAIPNHGGNCIQKFYENTPEGLAIAEAFAREHNKPGMGVYDCVSMLKEARRSKESVAEIAGLHYDIDARQTNETKEQIVERVRAEFDGFGILSKMVDSGRGIHIYSFFREPIVAGTPEAEAAERLLVRMIEHLGADPAPKHFAALMRRPGTTNSKEGGGPCQVILDTGARCELSDIESYLDLIGDNRPLFTRKSSAETNGGTAPKNDGPIDVDARLAAMQFGNKDGFGVNATIPSVIGALIWKAWHPDDIHKRVMDALKEMTTRDGITDWDWRDEEKTTIQRILSAYHNVFEKEYDHTTGVIPVWLPMEFHQAWAAILAEGRRPTIARNGSGFYVRRMRESGEKDDVGDAGENTNGNTHTENEPSKDDAPKAPFVLRPFDPFDPTQLPPRDFLFGRHYQRRTVSGTVAPGGTGKSSLVMVESVAMATARELLNEEVKEPLRVWYHNGEDNMIELKRRIAGICQKYDIPQDDLKNRFFITSGNEVPLRVAESWNQVRLQTDHRLVKYITEAIGDNKIDVAILDPLVTLHGVAENNPGQMDGVIRIFTRLSDAQNCAIDLSHHTRKLGPGADAEDYTIDDMRGARAISDAMRAVRMLNFMSSKDAENAGLMEIERTTYFRIDRAKANYSAPSKTAIWRRFENVDLPNGDAVGVVTPWDFPGQGATTPEKLEYERRAEHVFLEVLRRLALAGRFVGERGAHNAPHVFAKEREAKMAKVGKAAFDAAMRRLFDKGKIRIEEYTKADRHTGVRIVEV